MLAADELPPVQAPVFICGMARSGSTILLETLASLPGFASLRYADFPLLWTPWWWNRLRAALPRTSAVAVERAHRDGIRVTRDSPEAFEEPIWAHFFPHGARSHDVLGPDTNHPAFETLFRAHVAKLLKARGAARYLSKGNYNALRIGYLATIFPDARFLVPIREPASHVASLMRQDAWHATAPRATLEHIAVRGHHEFGPMKRGLRVPGPAPTTEPGTPDDWLRQWLAVYGHVLGLAALPELAGRILFVPHGHLLDAPEASLERLLGFLGLGPFDGRDAWLSRAAAGFSGSPAPDRRPGAMSRDLLARARALHEACARASGWPESPHHLGAAPP